MDIGHIVTLLQESLVFILVFLALLGYAMVRGRRALVSLILGLYLALLVSLTFPFQEELASFAGDNEQTHTFLLIGIFVLAAALGTLLFEKLLYQDYFESAFESFPKKLLLAFLASALVMSYSYHVLPLTNFFDPGAPASMLFGPAEYFFWWLIIPLVGLFVVL